jgi:hypothetical protein
MSNAIQSLWQHQEPELRRMSTDEIRRRADHALSEDRKHKLVALLTASLLTVCFVVFLFVSSTLMGRIGGVVGIGAGISIAYRAYRLIKSYPLLPSAFGIEAYRRILEREQRGLAICWQTMLLVQLGVVLEVMGDPMANSRRVVTALVMVAPVIAVAILTRAKAHAYGRRTRELDQA